MIRRGGSGVERGGDPCGRPRASADHACLRDSVATPHGRPQGSPPLIHPAPTPTGNPILPRFSHHFSLT